MLIPAQVRVGGYLRGSPETGVAEHGGVRLPEDEGLAAILPVPWEGGDRMVQLQYIMDDVTIWLEALLPQEPVVPPVLLCQAPAPIKDPHSSGSLGDRYPKVPPLLFCQAPGPP